MAKLRIFRWRAIGPLLVFLALLGVLWLVFSDMLIEDTSEEVSTELLGAQVDIQGLRLRETDPRVEIAGLQIADPFQLDRNLLETGLAILELDPGALLEKKLVIDRLTIRNLRFGTRRATPARPVPEGFASNLLRQVRQWSTQFDVPLLQLTPLDTIKSLILDPAQLSTVREVRATLATADSLRSAFQGQVSALDFRTPLDTARAVAERLAAANPARLGLAGTREAVQSVRRALAEIARAREQLKALETSAESGIGAVKAGVLAVDDARRRDYEFAKSLLQLPSFAAPDIGSALFGRVSVDRFEKAVYWAELAQRHLPPGLRPASRPAAQRLRMDGTTVAYPRERAYPSFLLREGEIDVSFTAFGASHSLRAAAEGLTSEPAVYGRPATLAAAGRIGGDHPMTISVGALVDHTSGVRDSALLRLEGVPLPSLDLPGLPFRLAPGRGSSRLAFTMRGDQVAARWSLQTATADWQVDSARSGRLNTLETLVWRVLSGLGQLEVTADLSGTLRAPRFSVRSNLDQAIAERVQGVLGEELRAAEARVRARVDSLVRDQVEDLQARADRVTAELRGQVSRIGQDLDAAKAVLEARLAALSGGLGGALGL